MIRWLFGGRNEQQAQQKKRVPANIDITTESRLARIEEKLEHVVTFKHVVVVGIPLLGLIVAVIVAVDRLLS